MENMNINPPKRIQVAAIITLSALSLFLLVQAISGLKQYSLLDNQNQNVITVSGTGDVYAKADIANISFSVDEVDKTVALAQQKATDKNNKVIDFLKQNGVDEKDIKTTGYNINPKYEYGSVPCAQPMSANVSSGIQVPSPTPTYIVCPPSSKQTLVGYEVTESVDVKLRDITKSGDILAGIGKLNVSNVSGLSFTIDNEDSLKADARKIAIDDAKSKAQKIADDLGTSLGKVTSFYENGDAPMYYDSKASVMGLGGAVAPAAAPQIATGQNKITVNVSVSYKLN